jgi:hypothetical protein
MVLLVEPQLFPQVGYMGLLVRALGSDDAGSLGQVWLEHAETFPKQTYRNRYRILTSQGPKLLSLPVRYSNGDTTAQVQLSYDQDWPRQHWRTLEAAYKRAPFWSHYEPALATLWELARPETCSSLASWQRATLSFCLESMGMGDRMAQVIPTTSYMAEEGPVGDLNGAGSGIAGKTLTGDGGGAPGGDDIIWDARNLIAEASENDLPEPKPYPQLFGSHFVPHLSVLDLLLNTGPDARRYLPTYL